MSLYDMVGTDLLFLFVSCKLYDCTSECFLVFDKTVVGRLDKSQESLFCNGITDLLKMK